MKPGLLTAGIGLRAACRAEDVLHLLRVMSAPFGRQPAWVGAFEPHQHHPALEQLRRNVGGRVLFFTRDELAAFSPFCLTRSEASLRYTGLPSVAECCALAAAGRGSKLLEARKHCSTASCALALSIYGRESS